MKEYYILDAGTYVPIGVMENDEVIEVFILEKNIDY